MITCLPDVRFDRIAESLAWALWQLARDDEEHLISAAANGSCADERGHSGGLAIDLYVGDAATNTERAARAAHVQALLGSQFRVVYETAPSRGLLANGRYVHVAIRAGIVFKPVVES